MFQKTLTKKEGQDRIEERNMMTLGNLLLRLHMIRQRLWQVLSKICLSMVSQRLRT